MRWVERYRDQLSFEDMAAIPVNWATDAATAREQARFADPKRARARERSRERRERMRSERPGNILG